MRSHRPLTVRSAALRNMALRRARPFRSDRIGAVGRETAKAVSRGFDPFPDRDALMARQAVHDDDTARLQFWHEHIGHVCFEPIVVDGPVEYHWQDHPGHA